MFEQAFKNIDDILRKDAGVANELVRLFLIFRKICTGILTNEISPVFVTK